MNKKAGLLHSITIQVILIVLVFVFFLFLVSGRADGRQVSQQVLEKQTALLIDSAVPGMSFEVTKVNADGAIDDLRIKDGKVFVDVNGLNSLKGYPYFSKYKVSVSSVLNKFVVTVDDK